MVINKNLGSAFAVRPEDLTPANEDGQPTVIPIDKQKYDFDRNGWILFPGVLATDEIEKMRDFAMRLHREPGDLAEHDRCAMAGPLTNLKIIR